MARTTPSISFLTLLLCISGTAPPALVQNPPETEMQNQTPAALSMEDCLRIALRRSPSLQKLHFQLQRAQERALGTRGIYDTRFSLTGTHLDHEIPTRYDLFDSQSRSTELDAALKHTLQIGTLIQGSFAATRYHHDSALPYPTTGATAQGTSQTEPPNDGRRLRLALEISQPIWRNAFGQADRARIAAADLAILAARMRLDDYRDTLLNDVHSIWWDTFAASEYARVIRRSVGRAVHLLEINRRKVADGFMEETDLVAAEAALATRRVALLESEDAAQSAADRLRELLYVSNRDWERTAFAFPAPTEITLPTGDFSAEQAYQAALRQRADIAALRYLHRQALKQVAVARQNLRPRLDLTASIRPR